MTYDDMLPSVLVHAPGCPDHTAIEALRDAAREFFSRTLAWRADLVTVTTTANVSGYALTIPDGTAMVKLLEVTSAVNSPTVVTDDYGREARRDGSTASIAWAEDLATLQLHPEPVANGVQYGVRVALRPSLTSSGIPDALAEHYSVFLRDGALARLLDISSSTWETAEKASAHSGLFNGAIARVSAKVGKSHGRGQRRVAAFAY